MNAAFTALAIASALAYLACAWFALRGTAELRAGNRIANIAALLAFGLQRAVPQSDAIAALASLLIVVAIVASVRRTESLSASLLSVIPGFVMLLAADREFFPAGVQTQFDTATLVLLCVPAPLAAIAAATSLLRRT